MIIHIMYGRDRKIEAPEPRCLTFCNSDDIFFLTKSAKSASKVIQSAKNAKIAKKSPTVQKSVKRRDFIVMVALSAHAERFGVSRMQDFLYREAVL